MTKTLLKNYYLTEEEWKEIAEEKGYDLRDYMLKREVENDLYIDNLCYTEDLLRQLDETEDIIVIADLGLWNGRRIGYKELSNKATDILNGINYHNEPTIYLNEKSEVRAIDPHHDGINYYRFRVWRAGTSQTAKDKFLNLVYNQEATDEDIKKYTKALRIPKRLYKW